MKPIKNPYKLLKCKVSGYDYYCNPKYCTCKMSTDWERKVKSREQKINEILKENG